jgi:hypothetical protein
MALAEVHRVAGDARRAAFLRGRDGDPFIAAWSAWGRGRPAFLAEARNVRGTDVESRGLAFSGVRRIGYAPARSSTVARDIVENRGAFSVRIAGVVHARSPPASSSQLGAASGAAALRRDGSPRRSMALRGIEKSIIIISLEDRSASGDEPLAASERGSTASRARFVVATPRAVR